MTLTPAPAASDVNKGVEEAAKKRLHIVGASNRAVRVSLGSVYAYCAVTFAARSAHSSLFPSSAAASMLASWVGVATLMLGAVVWASSGYHGQ